MSMHTVEKTQQAIIQAIFDGLDEQLALQFDAPIRWLDRPDDGSRMRWREVVMHAEPLAELWSQQQPMLNFPALLVHYQETQSTLIDECGDQDHAFFFFLDLVLTHPNPEVLNWYWLRYAEAIKATLRSTSFDFQVQITGQRINETGPLESLQLRRGLLDLQITF